jgi:hypothetical protein
MSCILLNTAIFGCKRTRSSRNRKPRDILALIPDLLTLSGSARRRVREPGCQTSCSLASGNGIASGLHGQPKAVAVQAAASGVDGAGQHDCRLSRHQRRVIQRSIHLSAPHRRLQPRAPICYRFASGLATSALGWRYCLQQVFADLISSPARTAMARVLHTARLEKKDCISEVAQCYHF